MDDERDNREHCQQNDDKVYSDEFLKGLKDPEVASKRIRKKSRCDRMLNLVVGVLTSIAVLVTLISAFVFPKLPPNGINVFFAVVIVMICASHLVLIYWYRQGDLDPKFRKMIVYNAFTIILLCVCGNLYIHGISKQT